MKAVKKKKDFTRGSVRVFFSYYTPHRKLLLLDLVMAVFAVAAELVFPYATRYALNRLLPNGLYKAFFLLMAGLLGAYLLRALAQYIVTVYGHELGVRVEADMREDIFAKVQTLSFAFFDKHRTGKLMSRMTTDLFDITELAHHGPETVIQASLTIAGAIVILATIRWELALILFLLLPVLLAVVMRLRLRLRARSLDVKRETAEINTAVEAGVSGIRTVKAFANEQDAMDKFRTSNEKFKKVKKSYYRIFGVFNASTEFAMALMQLVTLAAGGVFIMQGKMDAVDLITFSLYVSVFMAPIRKLTQFVEQFQKGSSGFLRFLEIMRAEPDVKDAPDAKELENVKGGVEYRDVSFHYQNGEEVLRHVDLTIAPGETLRARGPVGKRQDDALPAPAAVLRRDRRRGFRRRAGRAEGDAGLAPPVHRHHTAGRVPLCRHRAREHPLRPPRCDGRGGRAGGDPRVHPRGDPGNAERVRYVRRRARRDALRRAEAAHRHCARVSEKPADPRA